MISKLVAVSVLSALVGLGAATWWVYGCCRERDRYLDHHPKAAITRPPTSWRCGWKVQTGYFEKTIGRWAGTRKSHLSGWIAKAGSNDTNAITGATRQKPHTAINRDLGFQKQGRRCGAQQSTPCAWSLPIATAAPLRKTTKVRLRFRKMAHHHQQPAVATVVL